MGWRWYLYNKTLDQYYYTGSSILQDIQRDLKYVFSVHGWSLDHSLSYLSDENTQIEMAKVVR